jgi:hypothetical protein
MLSISGTNISTYILSADHVNAIPLYTHFLFIIYLFILHSINPYKVRQSKGYGTSHMSNAILK